MRKLHWLACCSVLVALPAIGQVPQASGSAVAAQQASAPPSDDVVRALLQSRVDKGEAKGIVVGILDPDGRRRFVSYGSAGEGAHPLGPDSLFEIGSISKTLTATVLADLVQQGKVALDDPVGKYLPASVRAPSRGGKPITLRHLATHTSGLPRLPDGFTPPDPANPYAHYTEKHLYEFLNRYELQRDPGDKPEYSNLGAGLLGHALARAAGAKDFKSLVQSRVLQPLGMKSTSFGRSDMMTKGHGKDGSMVPYWDVDVLSGAGNLNSSARDMLSYVDAQAGPARTTLERAIRLTHQPNIVDAATGRVAGLAWGIRKVDDRTILSHSGGTAGYRSFIAVDPERNTGVVVLSNSGGFGGVDNIAVAIMFPPVKAADEQAKIALNQ